MLSAAIKHCFTGFKVLTDVPFSSAVRPGVHVFLKWTSKTTVLLLFLVH